jgi:hypothetical protein
LPISFFNKWKKKKKTQQTDSFLDCTETHVSTNKNLDTIAPTADKTTYRLSPEGISYASKGQLWDFGVVSIYFLTFFFLKKKKKKKKEKDLLLKQNGGTKKKIDKLKARCTYYHPRFLQWYQ